MVENKEITSLGNEAGAGPRNKYDSAWKKVIRELFSDFLEFFYPEIHSAIDFSKEVTFLDKELQEILGGSNLGGRVADVLVKVHLKNNETAYICIIIHIEVQGTSKKDFMERMFIYYYRSFDKEVDKKIPVISLAMLTDDNENFREDTYQFGFLGFEIKMKVPMVKILDYKLKEEYRQKLETSSNPMAMIARAQLKSLEVKGADSEKRFEVTKQLIRQCAEHGYSKEKIRSIMQFFGWAIRLPDRFRERINHEILKIQKETKMEYIPLWERDSHEEGIRIGEKRGEKRGRQKGRQEGRQEGRKAEKIETAKKMLNKNLPLETISECTGLSEEEIKALMH